MGDASWCDTLSSTQINLHINLDVRPVPGVDGILLVQANTQMAVYGPHCGRN